MSGRVKQVARSKRSHRDSKNFGQFIRNAQFKADEGAEVKFGHMLAEEMQRQREENKKKENE